MLTIFRILFGTMLLVAFVHRTSAHIKGGGVSQREEGPLMLPLRVVGLLGWGGLLAYGINPRWLAWASLPLPEALRWASAGLSVCGILLAVWGALHLGRNVTRTVVTREDHQLIQSGPYRWVRHPLYTAGMLTFIGLGLLAANAFILIMLGTAIVLIVIRLPREEAGLAAAFGDEYDAYRKRTGAFFPRLG